LKFEHYGTGIAKGLTVTLKNLMRRPVTTKYPEQRLNVSRRIRGNELAWDEEKCTGCYTCARSCPIGVITIETPEDGAQGIIPAPCTQTCPAHVDAARYVRLIAEGKFTEALAVVRERIPFPSGCGLICAHPCESKCTRGQLDEPIAIRILKRFAWEHDDGLWKKNSKMAPSSGKKVAIIGAGPAGLTAGYYLAKRGHAVTVFEALPDAGGMMRYGIPEYRLPKETLRAEIKHITDVGVEIKTNTSVESPESLLNEGYDAVFIGLGAQQATGMGVEGEDDPGVLGGVYFLRDVNMGKKVDVGKRVAVIGGGNTAMDSARTSRRLGAEVTIVYRRTRAEMPASAEEIEEALHEGIKMYFLAAPSKVARQKNELQLECIRMKLGAPDASGRRRPEPVAGSEFTMSFDTIIAAIGQRPDIPESFNVSTTKWNTIEVDEDTLATKKEGVYAGGDVVLGPATVIEAIAAGRTAATSIDKYLGGNGEIDEVLAPVEDIPSRAGAPIEAFRPEIPAIPIKQRVSTFEAVELSLEEQLAVEEAQRCLRCDLTYSPTKYQVDAGKCIYCALCVESCPFDALFMSYGYEQGTYRLRELIQDKEELLIPDKRKPSGYAHPDVEATLPKQSLLLYGETVKKDGS
jgi:NADPH-dependent glutamate synthase beta subunit-like oxidoreductase